MNPIRRLAAALAGLGGVLLAFAAVAPAALAQSFPSPPPGQVAVLGPNRAGYPTASYVRTVVIGGMPGWQIALIAAAVALSRQRSRCSRTAPGLRAGRRSRGGLNYACCNAAPHRPHQGWAGPPRTIAIPSRPR